MKPAIQTLGQILYSPSQYVIPIYQRNYRWEVPQWEKLWESLLATQSPDKVGNHFMGFLVFVPGLPQPGQHTQFHLVDGQQRLTTLAILLIALRNIARELGQAELADEIHQYYLIHPTKKGKHKYRVLPKERDFDNFTALLNEDHPSAGRMKQALDYFVEQIRIYTTDLSGQLRKLFDTTCQRLEFMCATLEAENAYNIFKSLNSIGVPLGPADLIRNFIFMHVLPDAQDDFEHDLWGPLEALFSRGDGTLNEDRFSAFFRDFLMSSGRYVAPRETFPSFESRYEATGFSPRKLAQTLIDNARYYTIISSSAPDEDEVVTHALAELNHLDSSTTYPLLLALFIKRAAKIIDSSALAQAIKMLCGFIMRRLICGESSRGYGQIFVRAPIKNDTDVLAALDSYLLEKGWPDTQLFILAFSKFQLYRSNYAKEILIALERADGHKEPADLSDAQIEHIMPQTLNDAWRADLGSDAERVHVDWLHTPGNLTLSAYNQELWNYAFSIKRTRYAQSHIGLTQDISRNEHWTELTITTRAEKLANIAAAIWIGPVKASVQQPVLVTDSGDLRRQFWTGLHSHFAMSVSALPLFNFGSGISVRLHSGIPHIGYDLRISLQDEMISLDIWFWDEVSFPLWESIRQSPEIYAELADAKIEFRRIAENPRAYMRIYCHIKGLRNIDSWNTAYQWLAEKVTQVNEHLKPRLNEEIHKIVGSSSSTDDGTKYSATLQLEYWTALREVLRQRQSIIKSVKPLPQNWYGLSIGKSNLQILAISNTKAGHIRVNLTITGPYSKSFFHQLRKQKDAIETEFGSALKWDELPKRNSSYITLNNTKFNYSDQASWPQQHAWLADTLEKFDRVFRERVKQLVEVDMNPAE